MNLIFKVYFHFWLLWRPGDNHQTVNAENSYRCLIDKMNCFNYFIEKYIVTDLDSALYISWHFTHTSLYTIWTWYEINYHATHITFSRHWYNLPERINEYINSFMETIKTTVAAIWQVWLINRHPSHVYWLQIRVVINQCTDRKSNWCGYGIGRPVVMSYISNYSGALSTISHNIYKSSGCLGQ